MATKSKDLSVSIDARGFLRFSATTIAEIKALDFPFVDISIDPAGKRVALKLTKKEQAGSFRLLNHDGRLLVFIKGALNAAKMPAKAGPAVLIRDKNQLLLVSPKSTKQGALEFFPCRNSPTIPMASLDSRGTLILDRNCTSAINMVSLSTADAEYNAKKKEFVVSFQKAKGALNVRSVGSHANISFMGTLSSNGIALPKVRTRLTCTIEGKTALRFSVADLVRATR